MAVSSSTPSSSKSPLTAWIFPALLLCAAYSLLGLTFVHPPHSDIMERCVLMNPDLSRIWSVGHVEISLSYFGVFGAMLFYFLRMYAQNRQHLRDLGYALIYIFASFLLDLYCVLHFEPFTALLIGDAIVLTFTLLVSRQLWFQRLLGVFVPLVFFTCGVGHLLEGMSYWKLTYPVNVPWTMVTADIGFAILVNAVRFPAFLRGEDIVLELERSRSEARAKQVFFRDVLLSVTEGRLHLCDTASDLPIPLPLITEPFPLSRETMASVRHQSAAAAQDRKFSEEELNCLTTAVGEAAMNAVVHGGGGEAAIRGDQSAVQVWISDHGTGISLSQLPRATLELGYSTKDSLGHGFWLMLRSADSVFLLTGSTGTTLVLTIQHRELTAS
jgi:anti-sigma regulatory factor (Ser/Thr protein kinase)